MTGPAITTMDKAAVRNIAAETQKALEPLAEQLGLQVRVGGGTYDPVSGSFKPKVEFMMGNTERRRFEQAASLIGLKPEDYGREFARSGQTYKLVGINLRAPKFPLIAEEIPNGKRVRFPEGVIDLLKSGVV